MMHIVAQVVAIREDAAARAYRKRESQAPLVAVAARVHAHFHHTLAHRFRVNELRQVPNGIEKHRCPRPTWPARSARNIECRPRKRGREYGGTAQESGADIARGPAPRFR